MPRLDRREIAAIFLGGATGALLRVWLATTFTSGPADWPWAIFAINISGSFALGYFVTRLQERLPITAYKHPFLGTGVCGALTTFSTMQVELLRMLDRGDLLLAAAYAGGSIAAGFAGVTLGTAVVRRARLTW